MEPDGSHHSLALIFMFIAGIIIHRRKEKKIAALNGIFKQYADYLQMVLKAMKQQHHRSAVDNMQKVKFDF